jgi:hypothetical protein
MSTEGFIGFFVGTRNYGATAAFWKSLGFENTFETDHGSGQWQHPSGGPYVFIAEEHEGELVTHPILGVSDSTDFPAEFAPRHWGVVEATLRDPDGREVALHAPVPAGTTTPDADAHHAEKYG